MCGSLVSQNHCSKMKILFASSSFNGGGITSYAHEFINSFSREHELCVMLYDDSKAPINVPDVKIYREKMHIMDASHLKHLIALINDEIKPDVLVNSNAAAISVITPYLNDNIKILSVSHSLKYLEAEIGGMNSDYIDKIIALSHFGKEYLKRHFSINDDQKIDVVYNFVREHPHSAELLQQKKRNKRVQIVFPGGCAPSKTPELCLKVARRLVDTDLDFDLWWLGGNMVHLSRYFKFLGLDKVNDLVAADPRIHITGRVPREQAEEICSSANVFFFPSRREGCPISLIEAMRVGALCIVADFNNANKEIIQHKVNGFVLPHDDAQAFVDLITDMIKNHSDYDRYYAAAQQRYHELLDEPTWQRLMNTAVFDSPLAHTKRKPMPSNLALACAAARFKCAKAMCRAQVTLEEDIATLLRFYRLKNKK